MPASARISYEGSSSTKNATFFILSRNFFGRRAKPSATNVSKSSRSILWSDEHLCESAQEITDKERYRRGQPSDHECLGGAADDRLLRDNAAYSTDADKCK